MRKISKTILALSLIICPVILWSQETVVGLNGNPVAESYYSKDHPAKKAETVPDTITLPFIDDFSASEVEPDSKLWSDNNAFINSTYAIYPPSVGVATLDALDFRGAHYPDAGSFPYKADFLTSQPIDLNYPPSDSLYLSFFYQAGGLAEPPETSDSLILDFYDPQTRKWEKIWFAPGIPPPSIFKRVMLKIDNPEYLKKGFRFRFRNYASQLSNPDQYDKRANVDLWHIDYVKLNKNRFIGDTILRDAAFIYPVKSILKDYYSLPWAHFESSYNTQRAPFIEVVIKNHDSISRNVGTALEIRDLLQSKPVYKVPAFNNDLASLDSIHYKFSYNYPFNFATNDSGAFEIRTILQTDFFDNKFNDTLHLVQKFYDYYALDDGTAEASYGFRGPGTKDVSSAIKYNAFKGDSLRAVDIYFSQIVDSLNLGNFFYLNVWNDKDGKPGIKIVNQIGMQPAYSDQLNKFVRYKLDSPVFIQGVFYVGFTQTTELLLNVGLDLNKDNKPRIFNNLDNGNWATTVTLPGTPMMRPVFRFNSLVGYRDLQASPWIKVFPNPAGEFFKISLNDPKLHSMPSGFELIDISGRIVKMIKPEEGDIVNTTDLQNGMYFLRIIDPESGKNTAIKIVINH